VALLEATGSLADPMTLTVDLATVVPVDVKPVEQVPTVPEIVLSLVGGTNTLGAVTTPTPPRSPGPDLNRAADTASCGYDLGQAAGGDSDWVSSLLACATIGSSPGSVDAPGTAWGDAVEALPACARSFGGGTEVVLADGSTKPIAEVEVGDWVVAADPETDETGIRRVTAVWVHDDELVDLEIDGEALTTTPDHEFWNATDHAWQEAEDLDRGDLLVAADGTLAPVGDLDWSTATEGAAYNLTVDGLHTYYVATDDEQALVHNDCGIPRGFSNADEFEAFGADLTSVLRGAGLNDATAVFQGSSVTGSSFSTGVPFDVGRVGDFDIAIASRSAMDRASDLGVGLRSGGSRTGPLTAAQLQRLGLGDLVAQLSDAAGRPVNFMLFDSIEAAMSRGPSIVVPGR
jgi:hypothetical protein